MKQLLNWIVTCFINRLCETSTWISSCGLILLFLGLTQYCVLLLLIGIFIPEEVWDKFASDKGNHVKNWFNTLINK